MSVTYTPVLDVSEDGVGFVVGLLEQERRRRGARANTRVLTIREQAVLVLRWFLDDTRMITLARDSAIGRSRVLARTLTQLRAQLVDPAQTD